MHKNLLTRLASLKACLIRKGWGDAIELLDIIKDHDQVIYGSSDFTNWLRDGGTLKLMNIVRPYKGLPMYEKRTGPLPFDNDFAALDAAHHLISNPFEEMIEQGLAYRLTARNCGSDRLGDCEICGQKVDSVYLLVQMRRYTRPSGSTGITFHRCFSKFGHKECLAAVTDTAI